MELTIANLTNSVLNFGFYLPNNQNRIEVNIPAYGAANLYPYVKTKEQAEAVLKQYEDFGLPMFSDVKAHRLDLADCSIVANDGPFTWQEIHDLRTNYWFTQDEIAAERIAQASTVMADVVTEEGIGKLEPVSVERMKGRSEDAEAGVDQSAKTIVDRGQNKVSSKNNRR